MLGVLLEKDLIAKSREWIGKIMGLMLKKNPGVVDLLMQKQPNFEMDEVQF